ncbi:MAG: hypothetical protein HYS27_14610 [Deltaproteobacteria bacterium]|nr:hypothetical protein [Deltaproteobacteria bacterium]
MRVAAATLALALLACDSRGAPKDARQARFIVTDKVAQAGIEPLGATITGFGNSLWDTGSGFEPAVVRTRWIARADSPDRVVAPADELTFYDTLRDGALDGADVQVYRVLDGRMAMVREDRVAEFRASGWLRLFGEGGVVPKQRRSFVFRWDRWNRPGVPTWFAVMAVDESGNLSPASNAVSFVRPAEVGSGTPANQVQEFSAARALKDSTPPPAPQRLQGRLLPDGAVALEWQPAEARDLAGYVVVRADDAPERHRGFEAVLSRQPATPREAIKAGDLVVVSKKEYQGSRARLCSNRVWDAETENRLFLPGLVRFFPDEDARASWRLMPHEATTPVTDAGESYLHVQLTNAEPVEIGQYNHSGTDQTWYEVLERTPYTVEVWLRQTGTTTVQFRLTDFFGDEPHRVAAIPMASFGEWRKVTATFTPPVVQPGTRPNKMVLELAGTGTVDVDNLRVYRADTPWLAYSARELEELRRADVSSLRTHGFIKTGRKSYDLAQLTDAGGLANGTGKGNTLPQALSMMKQAGVRPWLQVEPHLTPKEWLGLVEYLAAPFDPAKDTPATKPWAAKRVRQGQARPWTDEFDRLLLELGNETWNGLFFPWTFEEMTDGVTGRRYSRGQVYGLFQEHVRATLRASPWWQAAHLDDKVDLVLGGWNGLDYGQEAASTSPGSRYLAIAAYNGGWDQGEGPPKLDAPSFFNLLNDVSQTAIPDALRHGGEARALSKGGRRLDVGTYEAGPGYALNGLNGEHVTDEQAAAQELVMKSLAAGTATLDAFLARAERGFTVQSFFTFERGPLWTSHAEWYRGGQPYPSWLAVALFNQHATGDLLVTSTVAAPTADLEPFGRRKRVSDAPLVAVYASRQGKRLSVFVLSRRVPGYPRASDDGYTPVTIELPIASARSITLHRMSGDLRADNVSAERVKVETVPLPPGAFKRSFVVDASTGADARGLPPGSTFVYVFEQGTGQQ